MGEARAVRAHGGPGVAARAYCVLAAILGVAGCVLFVATHPFGLAPPLAGLALYTAAIVRRRDLWLLALPALLPVVDLAPFTGMIYLTESDALVLATLAVAGVQALGGTVSATGSTRSWRFGPIQWLLVAAMTASYVVSTHWRVLFELPLDPALLVGYASPLNGPRLAKGFLFALLLLPLLAVAFRRDPEGAGRRLAAGVLCGVLAVSLAALWERLAYTGFTDFATDYRTTALFWEANVGGAALDGWLALSLPFLIGAAWQTRSDTRLLGLAVLLALAGYAVFTTFSRGLYGGVVVGAALTLWLLWRPRARSTSGVAVRTVVGIAVALLAAGAIWLMAGVFQGGGYRGLAAWVGLAGVVYAAGPMVPRAQGGLWAAAAFAVLGALASFAALLWLPKGVYVIYAVSVAVFFMLALLPGRATGEALRARAALGCAGWVAVNAVLVSAYWGGPTAFAPSLAAAAALLLPLVGARMHAALAWRADLRGMIFGAMVVATAAGAVITLNTYYASERLAAIEKDLAGRKLHWAITLALPAGAHENWVGIGTGQFAERYFWHAADARPGSHSLVTDGYGDVLRLGGPRHTLGFGELYRVSQRVVRDAEPPFAIEARVRGPEGDAGLHVELCRKHLLYDLYSCAHQAMRVPGSGEWETVELALERQNLGGASGLFGRGLVLSIANPGRQLVDVAHLSVRDARGRELVENGGFDQGTARWFFTSDRHHLPWHAKNLWLHYLVEHGWFGLAAFTVLTLAALFRVALGGAARHPLAPALAGGFAGFFVVGAFDSLVDVPRLALLFFLLTFAAMGLRGPSASRPLSG